MTAFLNDVEFVSSSAGLVDFGIGAAAVGYQLPVTAGAVVGATYSYTARNTLGEFESGLAVYIGAVTLPRTTVLDSSAGFGVKVNFTAAPNVVLTLLADDVREKLTADRTYYIATTGNDTTGDGSSGNPWATPQYALDTVAASVDVGAFNLTLKCADGNYVGPVVSSVPIGTGILIFEGNTGDNTAVTFDDTGPGGASFYLICRCLMQARFITMECTLPAGAGIFVNNAFIQAYFNGCRFVAPVGGADACMASAEGDGEIVVGIDFVTGNLDGFEVVGDWATCVNLAGFPGFNVVLLAATLTGTPAFSTAFASIANGGFLQFPSSLGAVGTATGKRFIVGTGGIIDTVGGTLTTLPGDVAGTIGVGGQYDDILGGVREKLTADRTYYVRTDGSDSNNGLANTAGGAFLTLQHAYDVIAATLDLGGNDVTVQVGAGTYTDGVSVTEFWAGGGSVRFTGDLTTPGNVIIDTTGNGFTFSTGTPGIFYIGGFRIIADSVGIFVGGPAVVYVDGKMEYGTAGTSHFFTAAPGCFLYLAGAYTVDGSASNHYLAGYLSQIYIDSAVTLSGAPDFSAGFAYCFDANISSYGSFTGAATGPRFSVTSNGFIDSNSGSSLTYFPGNSAGIITTGGQYGLAFDATESQTLTTTGASQDIDYSLGAYTILNLGHNVTTLTVSNWHPNGTSRLTLEVRNTGAFNITFPTGWLAVGGAAPTITSGNGKKDVIVLTSEDAGTTVYIHNVGQDFIAI